MSTARVDVRRAYRDTRQPLIGGVAMGLSRHLAVPVLWLRAGFVVTAAMSGLGIALYAGLWLVLPADARFDDAPPGLASATRGGRRPGTLRRMVDAGPAIALMALAFGAILLIQAVLGRGAVFWPMAIAVAGVALLWRQADEVQRERWLDSSGRLDPVRAVFGRGGWAAYARVALGVALVLAALAWALWRVGGDVGRFGGALAVVLALQMASGLSNVVLGWPLVAALAHSAGAAALVLLLALLLARSAAARHLASGPVPLGTLAA